MANLKDIGKLFVDFIQKKLTGDRIPDTEQMLLRLGKQGIQPATVIDCGAYVGKWTKMVREIFPAANFLMIEANQQKEQRLKKVAAGAPDKIQYTIALLGSEADKTVSYYRMESGSSIYEEQTDLPRTKLSLTMQTLDRVAAANNFSSVDLLKLDVQGAEIDILKGAPVLMKTAKAVLLEVSFLPYCKGAPVTLEVMKYMDEAGFSLFDIGSMVRWGSQHVLLQADFLFVRSDSALRPTAF